MNNPYPIPVAIGTTDPWYFYSNNLDSIGSCTQSIDARSKVTIDYTQLVPAFSVGKVWFEIDPGGAPALTIDSCVVTATLVTFYVGGGYSDISYTIRVNVVQSSDLSVHSDLLTVSVVGEDGCACASPVIINQNNYIQFPAQEVFVNKYPRFFVSGTAPTNANLLDRWYNLSNSSWYDYVTNGLTDYWALIGIGPPPTIPPGDISGDITIMKMQPLPIDGVTARFALISTDGYTPNVTTNNSLFVSIDGVWQEPTAQFDASGGSIAFETAPAIDSNVFILWIFGGIIS